jgi:hypothetical protein
MPDPSEEDGSELALAILTLFLIATSLPTLLL